MIICHYRYLSSELSQVSMNASFQNCGFQANHNFIYRVSFYFELLGDTIELDSSNVMVCDT